MAPPSTRSFLLQFRSENNSHLVDENVKAQRIRKNIE